MPIYRQAPSRPQGGANSANGHYLGMSVSVVASSRFELANLTRTESGEERLPLHKNHEGRAQAVRAMKVHALLAQSGRKCGMVELFCAKVDLSRYYDEGDSCSSLSLFKPPERCPAP
jgi:hypothetical protein